MLVKDFTYHLPQDLIARHPPEKRDGSRLMLLDRSSGSIAEDTFCNLQVYLRPGDLLVMNDTRVIPARLFGRKPTGGKVEIPPVEQNRDYPLTLDLRRPLELASLGSQASS